MSKIEWTDVTDNPLKFLNQDGVSGNYCQKVSPGCKFCYAERLNATPRFGGNGLKYSNGKYVPQCILNEKILKSWARQRKTKWHFVCSMTDWCGDFVPLEYRYQILDAMRDAKKQRFQLLTKRSSNLVETIWGWLGRSGLSNVPHNIFLGVSVGTKQYTNRIDDLVKIPCNRFLSIEPLLEAITIYRWLPELHWIIAGGESGNDARPVEPDWIRYLRVECEVFNVPFFFKQWGEWLPIEPIEIQGRKFFRDQCLNVYSAAELTDVQWSQQEGVFVGWLKVGKKKAGHLLDGKAYQQMPLVSEVAR